MNATLRGLLAVTAAIVVDLVFWDSETTLANGATLPLWLPPLATVVVHQSLWWRRSHPVTVFSTQCAFALVSLAVPLWQPCAGLLMATFAVALYAPAATSVTALAVLPVPFVAHGLGQARDSVVPMQSLLVLTGLWLAVAGATWVAGRQHRRRTERLSSWQRQQDELHEDAARAERLALARELHDGAGNTITAVVMQAATSRAAGNECMARIEATARRAMEEIQATLKLIPPDGAAPPRGPFLDELPELFALARQGGLDVRPSITGLPRSLPPDVDRAAYRTIQEGITNVLKYAPVGSVCQVDITWGDAELVVSVIDRPHARVPREAARPVLPATSGRGLAGLSERLRMLGGWIESGHSGPGFRLVAGLPAR